MVGMSEVAALLATASLDCPTHHCQLIKAGIEDSTARVDRRTLEK
jgi:hypothetical protein